MDMNLYEMIDLNQGRMDILLGMAEQLNTNFTIYLSIITGYLIIAFVAGKQLTKIQTQIASWLYAISALYLASQFIVFWIISHRYLTVIVKRGAEIREFRGLPPSDPSTMLTFFLPFGIYILAPLLMLGIVAPLYFMWSVRKSTT